MDIAQNTPFDPTAATSGTFTWGGGEGTHLLVINESYQNLLFKFAGGQLSYVPANDRRLYFLSGQMAQAQNQIAWSVQSSIKTINTINQVVVEVYAPGEEVPESYPAPVIRQSNVAGNIVASSLTIDTLTPHTVIVIKATDLNTNQDFLDFIGGTLTMGNPNGTVAGSVVLKDSNQGTGSHLASNTLTAASETIQNVLTNGITPFSITDPVTGKTLFLIATTGVVQIGDTGTGAVAGQIRVFGNPFGFTGIDASGNFVQNTGAKIIAQLIDASAVPSGAADLGFHVANANSVVSTVGGVDTFKVDNTGTNLLTGTMGLLTNGISRISGFSGACTTTSTFFNHNLGAVPDLIALVPDGAASATGRTIEYEHSTMTSTQVKVTGGASFNFRGIAIKF